VPAGGNGDLPLSGVPSGATVQFPENVANVFSVSYSSNRVRIVPTTGFSGIIRMPVTIIKGSATLTTEVVLTVLPLAVPSAKWTNGAKTSTITWPQSPTPTATGYIVTLEGRTVCRTTAAQRTCVVPGPLGRNANVTIRTVGGDETTSVVTQATPPRVSCTTVASVRFATNSAKLTPTAKRTLKAIAEKLNGGGFSRVCFTGHTDSRSTVMANKYLSYLRATNVQNYLDSLVTTAKVRLNLGYEGELRPAAPNTSKNNMSRNRRVDIAIG
jgi:outer membrane protein OmpA-like peptidoglycan-associated protein